MNEQTPTWSCPVCQRRIDYWEDLIIDEYFTEMLQNTPKHIDSVRVEPNGHVTIIDENPDLADQESEEEEETPQPEIKAEPEVTILLDDDDSGDEDVSAVPAVPPVQSSQESTTNNSIPANTLNPATIRRTPDATASSPQQPPRKKAKTSDVIDLTLSSDDEDDDNDLVRFTSSPPNPTTAQPLQEVPR
jgi:E3 SUMO-protein ligase PIAS1